MVRANIVLLVMVVLSTGCQPPHAPLGSTIAPAQLATPSPSPVASPTPTSSPKPTIVPTPTQVGGGSGKLIFELQKAGFQAAFPDLNGNWRVFTSNADGSDLEPVTDAIKGAYYLIEDVSPDGRLALISSYTNLSSNGSLYLVHLDSKDSEPIKVSSGLPPTEADRVGGIFLDAEHIILAGSGPQGNGIYIVSYDGQDARKIATYTSGDPSIEAANDSQVYWSQIEQRGFKDSSGYVYEHGGYKVLYWANLDGSAQGKLESGGREIIPGFLFDHYAFSPDRKRLAWIPAEYEPGCTIGAMDISNIRNGNYTSWANRKAPGFELAPFHGQTIDMAFAEAYVKRCYILYVAALADLDNPMKIPLSLPPELIARNVWFGKEFEVRWSPDGQQLYLFNDGELSYYATYQPILLAVNPADPHPILRSFEHELFRSDLGGQMYLIGFSPDGRQLLALDRNTKSPSFPYIVDMDLDTGSYQSTFVHVIAPGPRPSEQLVATSIRWLP